MSKKKSLREIAIESGKRINKEIFFNKKKRSEHKKVYLRAQKAILENEYFSIKPILKQEYDQRNLITSALAYTVSGLETVKKADEYDKTIYLTNCKFTLFKKEKLFVFKSTFLKPLLDKKKRTSYFYFPQGFPENEKKKAFIYKDGKRFSLKGYEKVDFGAFKQKVLDYKVLGLRYKGKKEKYDFKLTIINKEKQSYWVEKLFREKRS